LCFQQINNEILYVLHIDRLILKIIITNY
jgi:hypothetical protein